MPARDWWAARTLPRWHFMKHLALGVFASLTVAGCGGAGDDFALSFAGVQYDHMPPSCPAGSPTIDSRGPRHLALTWSPCRDKAGSVAYRVHVDGVEAAQTEANAVLLTRLVPSRTHEIQIVAVDSAGNATPVAELSVSTRASWADAPPEVDAARMLAAP